MNQSLSPYLEQVIHSYYENEAGKLHNMVDKILFQLRFYEVDKDDFYSLANEIFVSVLKNYDDRQDFDGFLYSCLEKKFKSEMTRRTRDKRCTKVKIRMIDENGNETIRTKIIPDVCIDTPLNDEEDLTLGDTIADSFDTFSKVFEGKEEGYSKRVLNYLSRLSQLQKKVLSLFAAGYTPPEIKEELHITDRQYNDCQAAIHSYRNVSILF